MKNLYVKAIAGLLNLVIILAAVLFISAGTLSYWQAWLFLAVFSISVLAITIYLMKNDPHLLERRVQAGPVAEKEKGQQIIQSLASIAFIAIFIIPGLDHRFGWSSVPLFLVLAGDFLVALGLLIVFFVFKENSYTSAVIEVGAEQKIVTTGPYALVRHPMYMGALIMLLGVPLALGSYWGLFMLLPITLVIIWRLLDEEKFLAKNLAGYLNYENKVRYHLIPFVW
jgi:protein-S-isoprenylcysteine O-methyltransferase Ste14